MAQEDDTTTPNNGFNLLNFVKTHAEGKGTTTNLATNKPSTIPKTETFTPMMFSRPMSPKEPDYVPRDTSEAETDNGGYRPSFNSMRFNPLAFSSSQPVAFTKPLHDTTTTSNSPSNKPLHASQSPSTGPKLSYSEVEMLNKPVNKQGTSRLPSKTKYGIGAALLKKMGYIEGKGLGKNNQGIVEPIKHDVRQSGRGLDVSKKNKDRKQGQRVSESDISDVDSSDDDEEEGIIRFKDTKSTEASPSLYQIILDVESLGVKVPDEVKELSNNSSGVRFIELNKEGTGDNIQRIKRELAILKDELADSIALRKQSEFKIGELKDLKDHVDTNIQSRTQIIELLKQLKDITAAGELSKEEKATSIKELFVKFRGIQINESLGIDIEKLLVLSIKPLIKECIANWDPLDISNSDTSDEILSWKESLPSFHKDPSDFNKLNYFQTLLHSLWYPKISEALETWPADQPNLPITLILDWGEVLDESIINDVMVNVISKNIIKAIQSWKIKTKIENPPYVWIFEWLPFLSFNVEDIKNEFIVKYNVLMDNWNGIDRIKGLDSFKEIIGDLNYTVFLDKKVIPKLTFFLTSSNLYRFNSSILDTSSFKSLSGFESHIPRLSFEKLLKFGFMSNWNKALVDSLCNTNDFYKIAKSLKSWYFELSPHFQNYPFIQEGYITALETVNKFLNGYKIDSVRTLTQHELLTLVLNKQKELEEKPRIQRLEVTFRDVIEDYCFEKGWIFEVMANDLSSGKKLFQIRSGTKSVTFSIDSDVIFVKNGCDFRPVSLSSLDGML